LAVDATALPASFAPVTVVSLAELIAPLLFDDLDGLRLEDAVERGLPRDRLPSELPPDLLFVC
jgi:hypothetical protein